MSYRLPDPPWDLAGTPAWEAWWDNLMCPKCGEQGVDGHIPAKAPHFAVFDCRNPWCDFQNWVPKPRTVTEQKRKRRYSRAPQTDNDCCDCCGLNRAELKLIGRQLEDTHRIDRAELIEAGLPADDLQNRRPKCNHCHAIEQEERRDARRLVAAMRSAA